MGPKWSQGMEREIGDVGGDGVLGGPAKFCEMMCFASSLNRVPCFFPDKVSVKTMSGEVFFLRRKFRSTIYCVSSSGCSSIGCLRDNFFGKWWGFVLYHKAESRLQCSCFGRHVCNLSNNVPSVKVPPKLMSFCPRL